ncbi:MAG: hypothetical protein DCC67_11405 [Planctomycetota bacterium]|nr:MAG: hypothetical protein DCC67_11405 [Planctomycetota bacterium]
MSGLRWLAAGGVLLLWSASAAAAGVQFFDDSQIATPLAVGETWDSVACRGYVFTYTRDKLFTGGIGAEPIGRPVRIAWPDGVEAQAVTAGPNPGKAKIELKRSDGAPFDLAAFTARLLANTAGAGGSIEIMPQLDGEDAWDDPAYFMASGYSWSTFSYDRTTPSYLGNTSALVGFESYSIGLYVDFAITALALEDASAAAPGDFDGDGDADGADLLAWQRGQSPQPLSASDLVEWQANFGIGLGTVALVNVPEPPGVAACAVLWSVGAISAPALRRSFAGRCPAGFRRSSRRGTCG